MVYKFTKMNSKVVKGGQCKLMLQCKHFKHENFYVTLYYCIRL